MSTTSGATSRAHGPEREEPPALTNVNAMKATLRRKATSRRTLTRLEKGKLLPPPTDANHPRPAPGLVPARIPREAPAPAHPACGHSHGHDDAQHEKGAEDCALLLRGIGLALGDAVFGSGERFYEKE